MAEALVRAPDNPPPICCSPTSWPPAISNITAASDAPLMQACAFALGFSARLVEPEFSRPGHAADLARRLGAPVLRAAARRAMRLLGGHFVFGETIEAALARAANPASRENFYSFDMLGEGARTAHDAEKHFDAYAEAIAPSACRAGRNGRRKGREFRSNSRRCIRATRRFPPSGCAWNWRRVCPNWPGSPRPANLGLTVDAEEADRLELSLDLFGRVAADPSLRDWDGLGLAVQAYQKRALAVIDHVAALARRTKAVSWCGWSRAPIGTARSSARRSADWPIIPVFTRKAMTDLNYLACADALLRRIAFSAIRHP